MTYLIVLSIGITMWAIYGWFSAGWPVVVTNVLALILTGLLMRAKMMYG